MLRSWRILLAATALSLPNTAYADVKTSNHTLGSGPDIWRIELRDADELQHQRAGDSDHESEIRSITWRLSSSDQYHQSTVPASEIEVVGRPTSGGDSYDAVRTGEVLVARIPEVSPGTQLWVHAKEIPYHNPESSLAWPTLRFFLEVSARDLDCARQRVCRRGDTGIVRMQFRVEVPPVRSQTCNDKNMLRAGLVGVGDYGVLGFRRLNASKPVFLDGQRHWQEGFVRPYLNDGFTQKRGKPTVAPVLGDGHRSVTICITSTTG